MSSSIGKLFVISAPSGAGKTSLVRALLASDASLRFSVSYTTRQQRPTEQDGRDYFFVSQERFKEMRAAAEFLEHAQVFDNFYGTSKRQVQDLLQAGHHVILEIDWQGARQIRASLPERVSIFILPPSRAELERRLRGRGTDSEAVIARRLQDSLGDISHWNEFDYVIVNDAFEHALSDLQAIVTDPTTAARLSAERPAVHTLVARLLAGEQERGNA
jgi:guanylate kinase